MAIRHCVSLGPGQKLSLVSGTRSGFRQSTGSEWGSCLWTWSLRWWCSASSPHGKCLLYVSSSGEGCDVVQLVKCWPGVHRSLGSVLSTTYIGRGVICW